MAEIFQRLEQNRVYYHMLMKVSDERKRTFIRPGTSTRVYVFDITTEDDKGNQYKMEYLSLTETQNEFVVGTKRFFRCSLAGKNADEIEPYTPPVTEDSKENGTDAQVKDSNRNLLVGGTSYSCAMVCASNIAGNYLMANPGLTLSDEMFRQHLFDLAEDINNWLVAKRDGL